MARQILSELLIAYNACYIVQPNYYVAYTVGGSSSYILFNLPAYIFPERNNTGYVNSQVSPHSLHHYCNKYL